MIRPAIVVLVLLLSGPAALAETAGEQPPEEQAPASLQLPDFAGRNVPGEAVVALADFISGYVAEAGGLPDFMQVQTADGRLRRISAAEAFVLLARTAYLWEMTGQLPETIPIAPDEVHPPVLDPEDAPDPETDLNSGRQIPTDLFLSQCGAAVSWVDTLHVIPTAVWVDGERLSAAQYLAGLAICVQHAYWEGELLDSIFLPAYAPPDSWAWGVEQQSAGASEPAVIEEEEPEELLPSAGIGWEEEAPEEKLPAGRPLLPTRPPEPVVSAQPRLTLFPAPGSTLSGVVDLVASYSGPPARFVTIAVDGTTRAIVNVPPYGYRWDTSALTPGPHTVRVQALGEGDEVIADQINGFTIAPPKPEAPSEGAADDL